MVEPVRPLLALGLGLGCGDTEVFCVTWKPEPGPVTT